MHVETAGEVDLVEAVSERSHSLAVQLDVMEMLTGADLLLVPRPVAAIYDSHDSTPSSQKDLIEANTIYRNGDADTMAAAEAIVAAHVAAHPELMAIPGKERAAAHS